MRAQIIETAVRPKQGAWSFGEPEAPALLWVGARSSLLRRIHTRAAVPLYALRVWEPRWLGAYVGFWKNEVGPEQRAPFDRTEGLQFICLGDPEELPHRKRSLKETLSYMDTLRMYYRLRQNAMRAL
jgi:hypothetical protein